MLLLSRTEREKRLAYHQVVHGSHRPAGEQRKAHLLILKIIMGQDTLQSNPIADTLHPDKLLNVSVLSFPRLYDGYVRSK